MQTVELRSDDITKYIADKLDKMTDDLKEIYKKLDDADIRPNSFDSGTAFKLLVAAREITEVLADTFREEQFEDVTQPEAGTLSARDPGWTPGVFTKCHPFKGDQAGRDW